MSWFGTFKGLINDNLARVIRIDSSTHAMIAIVAEHHEIHSGSYWRFGANEDVANGDSLNITFRTPAGTPLFHLRAGADVEIEGNAILYEGIVIDTVGDAPHPVPRNARRDVGDAGHGFTEIYKNAIIDVTGAIAINNRLVGSGKKVGGEAQAQFEWVLSPDTIYSLVVNNTGTATNRTNIRIQGYFHTDKN